MYHVAFSYTSDAIACNLKQMLNVSFMYIVHLVNMNDHIFHQINESALLDINVFFA